MPDLQYFISYTHKSSASSTLAEGLQTHLERNYNVFLDKSDLTLGDYLAKITAQLQKSQIFVILVSEETLESPWQAKELTNAVTNHVEMDGWPKIVPIGVNLDTARSLEILQSMLGALPPEVRQRFDPILPDLLSGTFTGSNLAEISRACEKVGEELETLSKDLRKIARNWVTTIGLRDRRGRKLVAAEDEVESLRFGLDYAVLMVWHPDLPGGVIRAILAEKPAKADRLRNLATVNLNLFPRGTTLTERFRDYAARGEGGQEHPFQIAVIPRNQVGVGDEEIPDEPEEAWTPLRWRKATDRKPPTLRIDKELWNRFLVPEEDLEVDRGKRLDKVAELIEKPARDLDVPNMLIEVGRYVESVYRDSVRKQRRAAIDWILANDGMDALCEAARVLCTTAELKGLGAERVSIGQHFELVERFIAFLQALAHFRDGARLIQAFAHMPDQDEDGTPEKAAALFLHADKKVKFDIVLSDGQALLKEIFEMIDAALEQKKGEPGGEGRNPLAEAQKSLLKVPFPAKFFDLTDEETFRRYGPFLRGLFKVARRCSKDVRKNLECSYSFVVGSGESWRSIEDTVSYEQSGPQLKEEDFAKVVQAHWSIFQQPRIAGFVDFFDIDPDTNEPPIFFSKLVRLKHAPGYEEDPIQVLRALTETDERAIAYHTRGDGRIRVLHKGDILCDWDPTTENDIRVSKVEIAEAVDEALRASKLKQAQAEAEETEASKGTPADPDEAQALTPEEKARREKAEKLRERIARNATKQAEEVLGRTLTQISDTPGESCLAVFGSEQSREELSGYLLPLDESTRTMRWRHPRFLWGVTAPLLRALLTLDGATYMSSTTIEPRLLIGASFHDKNGRETALQSEASKSTSRGRLAAANLALLLRGKESKATDIEVLTIGTQGQVTPCSKLGQTDKKPEQAEPDR